MGTRSMVIFKKGNQSRYQYNQMDGYPSEMGREVCEFIQKHGPELPEIFGRLKQIVGEFPKPTPEDVSHCMGLGAVDLGVSTSSLDDWYCLVRNAQHNLDLYARGLRFIYGYKPEKGDIYIEYQYLIDITKGRLTVKSYSGKVIFDRPFDYIQNESPVNLVHEMEDTEPKDE